MNKTKDFDALAKCKCKGMKKTMNPGQENATESSAVNTMPWNSTNDLYPNTKS